MRFLTLTSLTLLAAIFVAADAQRAAADEMFHGQVITTEANELVLSAGGDTMRFKVDSDAIISIDGVPAELGQLLPDHIADVTAKGSKDTWTATVIEARSQRVIVESNRVVPSSAPIR